LQIFQSPVIWLAGLFYLLTEQHPCQKGHHLLACMLMTFRKRKISFIRPNLFARHVKDRLSSLGKKYPTWILA